MKRLIAVVAILAVLITASSCSRNGYGCKGKGKIMTRVQ